MFVTDVSLVFCEVGVSLSLTLYPVWGPLSFYWAALSSLDIRLVLLYLILSCLAVISWKLALFRGS